MPLARSVIIIFFSVLLVGCAGQDIRQGVYQGIYEGARVGNMGHNTPRERADRPDLDYDQYSRERKAHMEEDAR